MRKLSCICSLFLLIAISVAVSVSPVQKASAAAPVCSSVSITGLATPGGTLTAIPVCSGSPTSYTYLWSRSTTATGTYSSASLPTSVSYNPVAGDVGYYFKVSVRGVNSSGTSASLSTVSEQVLNILDSDGDGKREITTCSELFTQLTNAIESFEISASGGTLNCASVSPQVPISGFGGNLNGNGAVITNVNISCSTTGCGIFGLVGRSSFVTTIENLTVDAPIVTSSGQGVGAVVGYAQFDGVTLNQITITGGTVSSTGTLGLGRYVGSILGYDTKGVVTNSSSSATVSGTNYVGGIAGSLGDQNTSCVNQRPSVAAASFSGSVTGASYVGGITGAFEPNLGGSNCKISQASSTGSVTSNGTSSCYLGGIVGQLWEARVEYSHNSSSVNPGGCLGDIGGIAGMMRGNSGTAVSMEAVWNTGTIGVDATTRAVGGLVGYCEGYGSAVISRSYNIGVIKGGAYSGGIAGTAGCTISNTFSRANVPAGSGGLLGRIFSTTAQKSYSTSATRGFIDYVDHGGGQSCTGSFWDMTLGSATTSSCSGATGKSTADMKLQSTFTTAAWDFLGESVNGTNDYWAIDSAVNNGYPFLLGVGVSSLSGGSSWTPPDVTVPTLTSGALDANGTSLVLTFSESLHATTAAASAFTVTASAVLLTPTSAVVSGSTVVLTLSPALGPLAVITVAYVAPASNAATSNAAVQDLAGNDAASFSGRSATNNSTADIIAPTASWTEPTTPSSSRILSYTLTFSEAVSGIAAGDFGTIGTATGCVITTASNAANLSVVITVTCSSDGTVTLRLRSGSVLDAASNTGPTSDALATAVTITSPAVTTTSPAVTTTSPAVTTTSPAVTTTSPAVTTTTVAATTTVQPTGTTTTVAIAPSGTGVTATTVPVTVTTLAVGQSSISTVTTVVGNTNTSSTTVTMQRDTKAVDAAAVVTTTTKAPVVTTTTIAKLAVLNVPRTEVGGSSVLIGGKVVEGVITRENNRLTITAGPMVVRIWAVAADGSKLSLDADGRLRVKAGDSVTVDAAGFSFNTRVEVRLYSDPVLLGRTDVDDKGVMNASYEIPEGIPSGNHNVVLAGERDGSPVTMALSVALGDQSSSNSLAVVFIGVLIAAGVTALMLPAFLRRRRKEESGE